MQILEGDVTSVKGFLALGKAIGIKKSKLDFAVIYCDKKCNAAAVYTKNNVKGAPLIVTKNHLENGFAQAIVINSGVANVCTGKIGLKDAKKTAQLTAKELGINESDVLVASTGVIGKYLPMEKIEAGIKNIKQELSTKSKVANAILTTDLIKKEICVKDENFTIGAIAKGSGMIHPNMATMLSFITTDAKIDSNDLQIMLRNAVNDSFNMLSVDMDTSTSDMCIILANGYAGKVDHNKFYTALLFVCQNLARKIATDGEGATKLVEVTVKNSDTLDNARKLAKSIISSNLFKCAAYGNDPNWGRILCAMGNSGAYFDESKVSVFFGDKQIVENGVTTNFDYEEIKKVMDQEKLHVTIDLGLGNNYASAFGCDLTEKYIEINAHYHT